MPTPEQIVKHAKDFKVDAWMLYDYEELVWWVKLLTKRATHRAEGEERNKDLYDAGNYFEMLRDYVSRNPDKQLSHVVAKRIERLEELKQEIDNATPSQT